MPKIHVLDKHTAELIAAGEVVERPSSVVKELMENAIDAGASTVSVEIQNGGVRSIRIADDGVGIAREDVPVAFLRHATSKVRTEADLDAIGTLGFRGEALASVCAVARVELQTRTEDEMAGTRYVIEGGEEKLTEDCARPRGTTITVRDLFYNVPARMKFLKKDVSESNSAAGVVDRIALSHPEISVRFVRDGKEELLTPGDGKLLSCIYAVFGKDFAAGMIPLEYTLGGIRVSGYISRPSCARANRTMQHFFINGRYVKTRTAMAALEEAYKGSIMVGKFPACVMHIGLPLETVDVNVHPAKVEVRFMNERPLFDAVYHGVKTALIAGDTRAAVKLPEGKPAPVAQPAPEQTRWNLGEPTARTIAGQEAAREIAPPPARPVPESGGAAGRIPTPVPAGVNLLHDAGAVPYNRPLLVPDILCDEEEDAAVRPSAPCGDEENTKAADVSAFKEATAPAVTYLGEAFSTYILAQRGESLFLIDKHAAHERILYNRFQAAPHVDAQMLLSPVSVALSREEYAALLPERGTLAQAGFEVEDFGGHSVLVRAVPMLLDEEDVAALIQEIAGGFAAGKHEVTANKLDWIYHSAACRAAVKGGDGSKPEELKALAERVLLHDDIRTCPHGRPVCIELTRHELEKQFGRTK